MGTFPKPAPEIVTVVRCPPLKSYAPERLKKMGAELRSLLKQDPGSVTPGVVNDYKSLRAQCEAINVGQ